MFNRNDKYGMAYSMEGRFPLASKTFMQYCLDIPTKYKIGSRDSDTKMLTKIAYKKILPKDGPPISEVSKYIEKYKDELIVIKYGGNVFIDRNIYIFKYGLFRNKSNVFNFVVVRFY